MSFGFVDEDFCVSLNVLGFRLRWGCDSTCWKEPRRNLCRNTDDMKNAQWKVANKPPKNLWRIVSSSCLQHDAPTCCVCIMLHTAWCTHMHTRARVSVCTGGSNSSDRSRCCVCWCFLRVSSVHVHVSIVQCSLWVWLCQNSWPTALTAEA